jgi:hypothetical protein
MIQGRRSVLNLSETHRISPSLLPKFDGQTFIEASSKYNILFNSTRPTKGTDKKRYDQKLQNSVFFFRSWITNYLKYRCVSRSNNFCIDTCVHFFSGLKCKKNLVASNQVRCEKVELSHSSIKLYETQHSLP